MTFILNSTVCDQKMGNLHFSGINKMVLVICEILTKIGTKTVSKT